MTYWLSNNSSSNIVILQRVLTQNWRLLYYITINPCEQSTLVGYLSKINKHRSIIIIWSMNWIKYTLFIKQWFNFHNPIWFFNIVFGWLLCRCCIILIFLVSPHRHLHLWRPVFHLFCPLTPLQPQVPPRYQASHVHITHCQSSKCQREYKNELRIALSRQYYTLEAKGEGP